MTIFTQSEGYAKIINDIFFSLLHSQNTVH